MTKKLILWIMIFSFSKGSWAGQDLSEKLIKLREEIQAEADQLEIQKKTLNSQIQEMAVEKGELKSRQKLLSLKNKEMLKTLSQKKNLLGGKDLKGYEGYGEELQKGLRSLSQYIDSSLPFKKEKRKKRVEQLLKSFEKKEITVAELFKKYWSFLQDEVRLSQSVELQKDTLKINQKEQKVEVLKLGMFQMFLRTFEGKLAYAVKTGDEWDYKFLTDSASIKEVEKLISAQEKNIKGGLYSLPIVNTAQIKKQNHKKEGGENVL